MSKATLYELTENVGGEWGDHLTVEMLEEDLTEVSDDKVTLKASVDHPMSGYASRFEYQDYDITIERAGEKFNLKIEYNRISGEIPKFMNEELQSGERDWDSDEIRDLTSDGEEKSEEEGTYDTIESVFERLEEVLDFEG